MTVSFSEGTRHQARSLIMILQALDNAINSVKEALPKGSFFSIFSFQSTA